MRSKVYLTDYIDDGAEIEKSALADTADLIQLNCNTEDELLPTIEDASALIVWQKVKLTERSFSRMPNCKMVIRCGSGYDNVDIEAARKHRIMVCNNPAYGVDEVADHAITLALMLCKKVNKASEALRSNGSAGWGWKNLVPVARNSGRNFGALGFGGIGMATALRAKAFGWNVSFSDPYAPPGIDKVLGVRRVEQDELLAQSDVLSLHLTLNPSTRGLINAETIAKMKPGAILVNTARGGLVEDAALLAALQEKRLAGAGLDVMQTEPQVEKSPLFLAWQARELDNVIITPHVAFYSEEAHLDQRKTPAEEVRRVLRGGVPQSWVNRW